MPDPVIVKAGSEDPDPLSGISYPIPYCLDELRKTCTVIVTEDEDEQTLIAAVPGATVLMITYGKVSRRVIEAGKPSLQAIIKMGTGIDSIDFAAARENGVRVANCPGYGRSAVAECAFMLMMNCMKKFIPIHHAVRATGWIGPTEENKSLELCGKTVGLVGFGHINSKLAQMCRGFDMQVQAYDPAVSANKMESLGILKLDSLDELAVLSDVVSICIPLTPQTRGLIDMAFLQKMRPQAFLINVGRGATVDERALLEALENGQIAGCGLDVFSQEPLSREDHPLGKLLTMDNVVIFPHLAAWTIDTWDRLQNEVLDHVMNVLHDRDLIIHSTDPRLAKQPGCHYPEGI
jgi:D-3-phosphoglycerate dehydrogenase